MRRIFLQIAILVVGIMGLVACSKNDSNQPGPTHMRWINVVPKVGFDIYSNSEKIASDLPFDTLTSYAAGLPGFYNLRVVKTGTSDTLINGSQQLTSATYYSTYILPDTTGGVINENKATVSIVTENTTIPSIDTAKLRFFNFAPFSPAINVVMSIDGRVNVADTLRPFLRRIYNDQSYTSSYSTYQQFRAGINWKFDLYNASDLTVPLKPIKTFYITLRSQGIFTLILKPIVGATKVDTFDYKIIERNF